MSEFKAIIFDIETYLVMYIYLNINIFIIIFVINPQVIPNFCQDDEIKIDNMVCLCQLTNNLNL